MRVYVYKVIEHLKEINGNLCEIMDIGCVCHCHVVIIKVYGLNEIDVG